MKVINGWLDIALDGHYGAKSSPRAGTRPKYLVMHATAGCSSAVAIDHFFTNGLDASGQPVQASSHIIIDQAGVIIQGVSFEMAAWANCCTSAGHVPYLADGDTHNQETISIEHVKEHTDNSDALTPIQTEQSFAVAAAICDAYAIPKRAGDGSGGIIAHADIDPVNRSRCPGPYPWEALWAYLKGSPPPAPSNTFMEQAAAETWGSTAHLFGGTPPPYTTGIAASWRQHYLNGRNMPPPLTPEFPSVNWNGGRIVVQHFAGEIHRCEWDGRPHWYTTDGGIV